MLPQVGFMLRAELFAVFYKSSSRMHDYVLLTMPSLEPCPRFEATWLKQPSVCGIKFAVNFRNNSIDHSILERLTEIEGSCWLNAKVACLIWAKSAF